MPSAQSYRNLKARKPRKQGHAGRDARRVNEDKLVVKRFDKDKKGSENYLKDTTELIQRLDESLKSLEDILQVIRETYKPPAIALNELHLDEATSGEDESDHEGTIKDSGSGSDSESDSDFDSDSDSESEDESSPSPVLEKRGRNTRYARY